MAEIMAYVNAILNMGLGFLMIVVMGFLLYLLGLAMVTMVRNKQPRWDAIVYVVAILVLGLAMWRVFPTIAIRTMRVSLEEARPEVLLLQDEIRRWIPSFEIDPVPPTPGADVPTPIVIVVDTPVLPTPTPTLTISATGGITVPLPTAIVPPATATPYPTYTPLPTATTIPTPTPCLVEVAGNMLFCPPTPVIGGN